jgi:hypothetical protein
LAQSQTSRLASLHLKHVMSVEKLVRKNDGPEVFGHYGYPICITYACSIQCLRVLIAWQFGHKAIQLDSLLSDLSPFL